MMQKSDSLSPRDLELISAYLDGDLAPKQAEKLEARLRQEAHLRRRMEEMRHTVAQLRELPPIKAPRNFTLTPEMAGVKPRRQPLFSFFRFASALAAAALVVVVGLDVVTAGGQQPVFRAVAGGVAEETNLLSDATQRAGALEEPEAEFAEPMAMEATEEQLLGEAEEVAEAPVEGEGVAEADCGECPADAGAELGTPALEDRGDFSAAATATAKSQVVSQDEEIDGQVDTGVSALEAAEEGFWTSFRLVEVSLAGLVAALVVLTLILRRQHP